MRRPDGDDGPIAEAALRRALRLEADELPRRLDPAAVIAAARARSSRRTEAVYASAAAFATVSAVVVSIAAAAALGPEFDPSAAVGPLVDVGVGLLVTAGIPVLQVASALTGPTPAIVSLAALIFAVLHERVYGEERSHVVAS